MLEKGEEREIYVGQIAYEEHDYGYSMYDIPSDNDPSITLSTHVNFSGTDIAGISLQITNYASPETIPSPGIRFESQSKGGKYPHIPFALGLIRESIQYNNGLISNQNVIEEIGRISIDKSALRHVAIEESLNPQKPRLKVKNIRGDNRFNNRMDIEIGHDGNVKVKMYEINKIFDLESQKISGEDVRYNSIGFKTEENGGQYPVVAFVFTQIAEGFLRMKKQTINV